MEHQALLQRLEQHGQQHVLRWWDELSADGRRLLIEQLDTIDFDEIESLVAQARSGDDRAGESAEDRARRAVPPSQTVRLPHSTDVSDEWHTAAQQGAELLAAGRVGVILVAGGQGTRLGFPHPKGMYPIGPVSRRPLFQFLAEQVVARCRRHQTQIPYYVMTSDATHDQTVSFFRQHDSFGLDAADVMFFRQGNMPAVDVDSGRLLLADKGRLSTSPDGHGGILDALKSAGLVDDMRRRGVDYLFYHQVDNPTAIVCNPAFLGFHEWHGSELSTKVVAKRSADERMGVLVELDGQTQIIEYIDMPDDVKQQTDADGRLRFWAGNTAIHVFSRDFLERLTGTSEELAFHLARKKVPFLDESGQWVEPPEPNAYKFEKFIFDALPFARKSLVVEGDRAREFNPVKNSDGHDSPKTAQAALTSIWKDWLNAAGAQVADGVTVEISPLFALDEDDVQAKVAEGQRVEEDTLFG